MARHETHWLVALLVRERWELGLALALEAHWLVGLPQMFNVYAFGVLPGCVQRKQGTGRGSDDAPTCAPASEV